MTYCTTSARIGTTCTTTTTRGTITYGAANAWVGTTISTTFTRAT